MSSIFRQKVGNQIYLYESVSYRNVDGKPRNKRSPIGKIDPFTGEPIYNPEYLARMAKEGTPIEIPTALLTFSATDIRKSSIRDYGAFHLILIKEGAYGAINWFYCFFNICKCICLHSICDFFKIK